jgi:L-alanine-DL-glutamate epimerase-like enolase superfamily enzyme
MIIKYLVDNIEIAEGLCYWSYWSYWNYRPRRKDFEVKIVEVETLRPAFQKNLCIVRLRTDTGIEALGDAYYSAEAVEAYVHNTLAPLLLNTANVSPERFSILSAPYVGFQGGGVELRAIGAIDIALWDLVAKQASLPLAWMLGGPVRDRIRIYNTCAGPGYVSRTARQHSTNWGVRADGHYEDLDAFLNRPAELAAELLEEGVTGMKVWPFDQYAEATQGNEITQHQLSEGVRVVEQIRAVADAKEMSVMVELHGLWNRPSATQIAHALTDLGVYWLEDPIRPDAVNALQRLRDDVTIPIAIGETAVGIRGFLPLLESGIASFVTVDAQWVGGLTQARKVAAMADAFVTPIAPHDCTGPISFAATCHLTMSQPNAIIQESVRAFIRTWYSEIVVDGLPTIENGELTIGAAPGLGISLSDRLNKEDVYHRITRL